MPKPYFHDRPKLIRSIIKVDHAGEYGAVRIYKGQIDATKICNSSRSNNSDTNKLLTHMLAEEERHLAFFASKIIQRKATPTIFLPLWHAAGYALGFITSLCGAKTAMLCTQAVEEVIDEHYSSQIQDLKHLKEEMALADKIEEFRLEELKHKEIAISQGSLNSPLYHIFYNTIKAMCKLAIGLSKRI
ncbi:MAG: demethoxyubiquinone hydroxylase family protein [Pseudomonadota bacterium]